MRQRERQREAERERGTEGYIETEIDRERATGRREIYTETEGNREREIATERER